MRKRPKMPGLTRFCSKAICATESGFNPDSINPEQDFTLGGVSYTQNNSAGRSLLVQWIKAGNDPASIGLNPSCGLAQVRVGNAKKFISGLDAWDLFDPATGLEAGAYALADMGATLDTADMYNVGPWYELGAGRSQCSVSSACRNVLRAISGDF